MSKKIAILCAHDDAHIAFVEKHLTSSPVIIDPQDVMKGTSLSVYFEGTASRVIYDGQDISDVAGIWARKPRSIAASDVPVHKDYQQYSSDALNRLVAQLLAAFPVARWISDVYNQHRASNKALQLLVAQRCGFKVPSTLFTSDPSTAKTFIEERGGAVSKPLATSFPIVDGRQMTLATTRIDAGFMPALDGLRYAPAIFQDAVDVALEVRATVVGDRVFAAAVTTTRTATMQDTQLMKHIRDNRKLHKDDVMQVAPYTLPADVASKCVAHCTMLGLSFGAIDLIQDKQGAWWFLENNPNGQWAFVEAATGLGIGKAIADYLQYAG